MPIYRPDGMRVERVYFDRTEIDHVHVGDGPSVYDKRLVPVIRSFTASPAFYTQSPTPPPVARVDWDVADADSVVVKEVIPYFADHADGVVTTLAPDAVADGGVELTAAAAGTPFNDHYGYLRAGIGRTGAARGSIADEATSLVQAVSGHRAQNFQQNNFHISWTGMPQSGQVYGRWVPTTGNPVDFTLTVRDAAQVWTQWAPGIAFPTGTRFYNAQASNVGFAGVWNAASGLPAGRIYIYEDAARTQQINLRTIPISDGTSVTRQLMLPQAWRYIHNWGFELTASNTRGKSVARAMVQYRRPASIRHFRMRAGSFARHNFNNNIRWIVAEWEVSGWPRPELSLAYAPDNAFAHPLRLTAANPGRRTTWDETDTGTGDNRITITAGSGEAKYRLTARNSSGMATADFAYTWPA